MAPALKRLQALSSMASSASDQGSLAFSPEPSEMTFFFGAGTVGSPLARMALSSASAGPGSAPPASSARRAQVSTSRSSHELMRSRSESAAPWPASRAAAFAALSSFSARRFAFLSLTLSPLASLAAACFAFSSRSRSAASAASDASFASCLSMTSRWRFSLKACFAAFFSSAKRLRRGSLARARSTRLTMRFISSRFRFFASFSFSLAIQRFS
mmetsp:Transcript_19925/g.69104  ORF Transcript_19925/g.69104 Transcript_19925/m.69104 type:complete len:214 (-) Transcript_19925:787-1428(-)